MENEYGGIFGGMTFEGLNGEAGNGHRNLGRKIVKMKERLNGRNEMEDLENERRKWCE
jgi:hypothetical protein